MLTFSPIHNEINELRKQLDKLAASTTSSPFSLEIQQASLPTSFRMPTIMMYKGKTDPQDHLDAFNDQMDLFSSLVTGMVPMLCGHIDGNDQEVV